MRYYFLLLLGWALVSPVSASSCHVPVVLQVLGSGGPELNDNRVSSGYQVWLDGRSRALLDMGSGTSFSFDQSGASFADIDVILLSHLHTDHSADLPAFIKGSYFTFRTKNLLLLGPEKNSLMPATSEFLLRFVGPQGAFPYLSDYLIKDRESYWLTAQNVSPDKDSKPFIKTFDWGKVSAIATHHGPIPALAWRVELAGCVIVYSGDMSNRTGKLADFARDADLLILHMAIPQGAGRIARNLHMSPTDIADIAAKAKPKKLLLSHLMRRSERELTEAVQLIQSQYQGEVVVASRLLKIQLDSHGDVTEAENLPQPD